MVVVVTMGAGTTLVRTFWRPRLEELPAAAPAAPAQQKTQQMTATQIPTGMTMVTITPAMIKPTTRPVELDVTKKYIEEKCEERTTKHITFRFFFLFHISPEL